MNVAVLGGSNGGFAAAADLALAGHAVRLWRRAAADLEPVRAAGGITLRAEERHGLGRLERVTADLGAALDGADVVLIALPATTHETLARELATRLTDGQIVLVTPGTLGAYVIAREIARAGGAMPCAFAETGTLPYLARKTGPAEVAAPVRAANLPVGVLPAARTADVVARLRELYPSLRPCADVLDAALTNAGIVIHPPLVLLNAGAIDSEPVNESGVEERHGFAAALRAQGGLGGPSRPPMFSARFDIHATGTTANPRRVIDAVDGERLAARRGWGYPAPHYELATYYDEARAADGLYGAGARARLVASGLWSETLTYEHRYVTEDAALGLPLFESAARTAGVATPASTGLLLLFGVLLGRQLTGRGRALENHGLGDFSLREIRQLLHDGWASSLWAQAVK